MQTEPYFQKNIPRIKPLFMCRKIAFKICNTFPINYLVVFHKIPFLAGLF